MLGHLDDRPARTVPLARPSKDSWARVLREVPKRKPMANVLIVDDSSDTVEITTELLESAGHQVRTGRRRGRTEVPGRRTAPRLHRARRRDAALPRRHAGASDEPCRGHSAPVTGAICHSFPSFVPRWCGKRNLVVRVSSRVVVVVQVAVVGFQGLVVGRSGGHPLVSEAVVT